MDLLESWNSVKTWETVMPGFRQRRQRGKKSSDGMVKDIVCGMLRLLSWHISIAVDFTDAGPFALSEVGPKLKSLGIEGSNVLTNPAVRALSLLCPPRLLGFRQGVYLAQVP